MSITIPREITMGDLKQRFEKILLFHVKPKDLHVATLTISCHFNDIEFYCSDIASYLQMDKHNVVCILGSKTEHKKQKKNNAEIKIKNTIYRTCPDFSFGKVKKPKPAFYNQMSLYLYNLFKDYENKDKENDGLVHVKIFNNGTLHITGCQNNNQFVETVEKVIYNLKKKIYIKNEKGELENIKLVSDYSKLNVENLDDIRINMINSNFNIKFCTDLQKLAVQLNELGTDYIFNIDTHPCIHIKKEIELSKKIISIFIFEDGNITITGGTSCFDLFHAYTYINKLLLSLYHECCYTKD